MYNKENYRRIKREFQQKHFAAEENMKAHRAEAERMIPELAEIDRALAETGVKIFGAAMQGKEGLEERIAKLRAENEELLAIRGEILASHGYPRDYVNIHYDCPLCKDTGFTEGGKSLCTCMKRALTLAGYESSGIGGLLETQNFASFSLDYYKNPKEHEIMRRNLEEAEQYVKIFSDRCANNILMFGATGLGKTHLSTAIAKAVIDRGYDVVYDTAVNIFSDFEAEHFSRSYQNQDETKPTDRYFDCDLLIIDDLGAELSNQFTVSCLYNLLNTRLNHGKSVIISTNLTYGDITKRYTARVSSRLLGEYHQFHFVGTDVRMEKIRG
ncbi:MAG: ATP-binding protein [Clostridia bacterium]|nr:ATP-binding protein [Clostridia bacterium]